MRIKLSFFMATMALLSFCLPASAQKTNERAGAGPISPSSSLSGTFEQALPPLQHNRAGNLRQRGGRPYLVHIPKSYDSGVATPVLVALHGGGGDMKYMADDDNYGLISKSESAGFILVFPNGTGALGGMRLSTWNAGNCCAKARDQNIDDVAFIRAVVAQVKSEWHVDESRIFATGMSNGAMMAHRLACEAGDVFGAIAAVAGTNNTTQCAPAKNVSVLQIHALDDTHVLFNGGAGKDAFRDIDKVTDFVSVPKSTMDWSKRNSCSNDAVRVLDVPGAYCERYTGCASAGQVELCVTQTGGHSWPGAAKTRSGKAPASQALSANDRMWEFFLSTTSK